MRVPGNNTEIQAARELKIPVIKRSEALAEIMRLKRGLVVAGTHGKTTTTHLLAQIFIHNKKDPTVVIGGRSHLFQSTAFPGKGKWFIAESDESDGGFKSLSPEMAVITNIDRDHLDYYGSFGKLKSAFLDFVLKVPFYGCVVAWGDQAVLRDLLSNIEQKVIFYGFNPDNHFILKKDKAQKYKVFVNEQEMGLLNVPLPGSMNALNTLAACAAAMTIGFSFEECSQSFLKFKGVDRRFHKKAELNPNVFAVANTEKTLLSRGGEKQVKGLKKVNTENIEFYDDYAHHPTEVRAVLSAFREKFGRGKRLIVLFQPHRFSRTADCWSDFLTCFKESDHLFLTDIYSAGESPMKGISSDILAKEIQHPSCYYCSEADILTVLLPLLKGGDVFITMGAGSIYKYGDALISQFRKRREDIEPSTGKLFF